jgi:hypothetical protein
VLLARDDAHHAMVGALARRVKAGVRVRHMRAD